MSLSSRDFGWRPPLRIGRQQVRTALHKVLRDAIMPAECRDVDWLVPQAIARMYVATVEQESHDGEVPMARRDMKW